MLKKGSEVPVINILFSTMILLLAHLKPFTQNFKGTGPLNVLFFFICKNKAIDRLVEQACRGTRLIGKSRAKISSN
jgi:hypothetical protein